MLNFLKTGFVTVYMIICFIGCSDIDKRDNITYGYLTATHVEAIEIKPAGELSKLQVTYSTNNTCQSFTQFRILKNMNNITNVGVIGSQIYGKQCTDKKRREKSTSLIFVRPKLENTHGNSGLEEIMTRVVNM